MNWRIKQIRLEVALCAARYSGSRSADMDPGGAWVVVNDFRLPPGYNRSRTDVALLLPSDYPATPPDWFYVDPGLRGSGGVKPAHYFERLDNVMTDQGWASCSLHIRSWRPSSDPTKGHSLLSVFALVDAAFRRWQKGAR